MYMKITSFNCYDLQFYEQLYERLKEALQNNVTRSTGLYVCSGLVLSRIMY